MTEVTHLEQDTDDQASLICDQEFKAMFARDLQVIQIKKGQLPIDNPLHEQCNLLIELYGKLSLGEAISPEDKKRMIAAKQSLIMANVMEDDDSLTFMQRWRRQLLSLWPG